MAVVAAFVVPHPPIILPAVGKGEEHKIQATFDAYDRVAQRIAQLKPDTIVLSSPHATLYADYFHLSGGAGAEGSMAAFRAPQERMSVTYDQEFVAAVERSAPNFHLKAGTLGETEPNLDHATFIPLWFLNRHYTNYQLVRIGLSGFPPLEHYRMGRCLGKTAESLGRRVVYVASGDLSHRLKEDGPYGFDPAGPEFDTQLVHALAKGDFRSLFSFDEKMCEDAGECGLRSFQMMAGALDGLQVEPQLLSYEGPFGVGYCVASFEVEGTDDDREFEASYEREQSELMRKTKAAEDPYVKLARLSLETFVRTGKHATLPDGLPGELLGRTAGCFVSLKEHGQLRGCIGTISATQGNLALEILQNAVSACSQDPRFDPVEEYELPNLVYSVDVLGPTERIDTPEMLDVRRYGVIVEHGARRGLLLPNLDGVDTVEEQIAIAKQKAGIPADTAVRLQRFEVVRHH